MQQNTPRDSTNGAVSDGGMKNPIERIKSLEKSMKKKAKRK